MLNVTFTFEKVTLPDVPEASGFVCDLSRNITVYRQPKGPIIYQVEAGMEGGHYEGESLAAATLDALLSIGEADPYVVVWRPAAEGGEPWLLVSSDIFDDHHADKPTTRITFYETVEGVPPAKVTTLIDSVTAAARAAEERREVAKHAESL